MQGFIIDLVLVSVIIATAVILLPVLVAGAPFFAILFLLYLIGCVEDDD